MKLQARSSKELAIALGKSAKNIGSKNSIAILDYVLLSQNAKGDFFFTSATSDSQLTIPAPFTIIDGTFTKPIALPVKNMTSLLATLSDCTVNFDFVGESGMTLEYCTTVGDKTKSGKASMVYQDGSEFPKMAAPANDILHISLPGDLFIGTIDQARNFIDNEELRPIISALCIDVAQDLANVNMVGTNMHLLYKRGISNDPAKGGCNFFRGGTPGTILLHMNNFRALSVFAGMEQIDIESDGHNIRITSGDVEFICKGLEGKYPNYNAVIPRNNPYYITFDKKEMLSVIKRVSMFSSESSNLLEIKKSGMFVEVLAQDIDFGLSAHDQVIIVDSDCPDDFRIGFNAAHIADAINALDGDTIRISLSDPSRAGVLTPDEPSPSTLALLMPMLLND